MWREPNRDGIKVARCTVERLMREIGLEGPAGQEEEVADHRAWPCRPGETF